MRAAVETVGDQGRDVA